MRGDVAHIEIPHGSAAVDHPGDARQEISLKRERQPLFDPLELFLIWAPFSEIDDVGTRVQPSGLSEMHVRIDESGNHPFSFRVDGLGPGRHAHLSARADGADLSRLDHDRRVSNRRAARAGDHGSALNRNRIAWLPGNASGG